MNPRIDMHALHQANREIGVPSRSSMNPRLVECAFHPDSRVRASWDAILQQLRRYSYFQTPAWSDLLVRALPQAMPFHIWARFEDGVEVVLPLISLRKRYLFHKLESLPWGTYGGWLSASPLTNRHRTLVARQALGLLRPVVLVCCNPLDNDAMDEFPKENCFERVTEIVDTSRGFDELWMAFQARNRTAIRRAHDKGVSVRWGCGKREFDILRRLYRMAQQSWNAVETLPDEFFQALAGALGDGMSRVWIAEIEGKPVAADLFLYGKGEAQYFAGASDRNYSKMNPSRLLMCEALRDACERGVKTVNLGASAGLEGVERFKRLFAGEQRRYSTVRFRLGR